MADELDEVYDFGYRLKDLRNEKGFSQAKVEDLIGIAKGTLSRYERCITRPKFEIIM